MDSQGYVFLPADVADATFPGNTNNKFEVTLHTPLRLNAATHEIGLDVLQYTGSWDTMETTEMYVCPDGTDKSVFATASVSGGRYPSFKEVIEELRRALQQTKLTVSGVSRTVNMSNKLYVSYNSITRTCLLQSDDAKLAVSFAEPLANVLGFRPRTWYAPGLESNKTIQNPLSTDLHGGMTALYVYTNLVQPREVGGSHVRLLRAVTINHGETDRNNEIEFRRVQYLPVETGSHRTALIDIRKDNGEPVTFRGGKVQVTLHVRHKS